MAPAPIDLVAPNGVKWSQPTGLFINNEFVASSSGQTLETIDPAYVYHPALDLITNTMQQHRKSHRDSTSCRCK